DCRAHGRPARQRGGARPAYRLFPADNGSGRIRSRKFCSRTDCRPARDHSDLLPGFLVKSAKMIALIIHILIAAIIVGLLLWILETIPVFTPYRQIVRVVVVVLFVLWLVLQLLPLAGIRF